MKKILTIILSFMVTLNFILPTPTFAGETSNYSQNFKTIELYSSTTDISKSIKDNVKDKITEDETASKRIIIKYSDTKKAETIKDKITKKDKTAQIRSVGKYQNSKFEVVEVSDSRDLASVINDLNNQEGVEYAQEDFKLTPSEVIDESDLYFPIQWGLINYGQTINNQEGELGTDIDIFDAWNISKGSPDVVVAVLDTGIDIYHAEFKNKIFKNVFESLNGTDEDGNGLIDDTNGWDFYNDDNSLLDSVEDSRHGTHVAGIIAAEAGNGGISGVAPNVKILPLKFINGTYGYTSDAIAAIEYASEMGVRIINCSWGSKEYNPALYDVIRQTDALFVCAAGNNGDNAVNNPIYPANYALSNVISVAAVNNKGELAEFSNYGLNIDVAAPGVNILSTMPDENYGVISGTSMATPFVTGIASLVLSVDPSVSSEDIKNSILNGAEYKEELDGKIRSKGIVNAFKTLGGNEKNARLQYQTYIDKYISGDDPENSEASTLPSLPNGTSNELEDEIKLFEQQFAENMKLWKEKAQNEQIYPLMDQNQLDNFDLTLQTTTGSAYEVQIENIDLISEHINTTTGSAYEVLNFNQSTSFYKLKPKDLVTNFTFETMSATITSDEHNFKNIGSFRTNRDLVGMSWETIDRFSHDYTKYPVNFDMTNLSLTYNYMISGDTPKMNDILAPTLSVETNSGEIYYVRLWNYVVDRPIESWEQGASSYYNTDIKFPAERTPGNGNGNYGTIQIDFNNLYAGWSPYYWQQQYAGVDALGNPIYTDQWLPDPTWVKIPVNNIKRVMWAFVPTGYYDTSEMNYYTSSHTYSIDFYNWSVAGNSYLGDIPLNKPLTEIRLCDDYDDIYNLTPERVVNEYTMLGYSSNVNFYVGASHYYDKAFDGNKMSVLTEYPFNNAFEGWYKDYLRRLKANGGEAIHSISMESVDAPESWWQRTWDGQAAYTHWTPTPHLLSFVNYDVKMFYKSYVENLARLSQEVGMKPKIQLGEPWWWYNVVNDELVPCFYDSATRYQFNAEMGYPMYEFKTASESIVGHEDVLYWLRDKNGEFSLFLRDSVKAAYPSSEFTVLFFPPSVLDKSRVPMMMSIVNFPKDHWKSPNLDFFMLEDYDYLIDGHMDKHDNALSFVQENLGYPVDKIHYFAGFVLDSQHQNVWRNINQALNDAVNKGFAVNYIWAYTQVKRDNWNPPTIINASSPSGTYEEPIRVSLSNNALKQMIYTTDGTDPSIGNGIQYSVPISIDETTQLKVAIVDGGIYSEPMKFEYTLPLKEHEGINIIVDGNSSDWDNVIALGMGSGKIFDVSAIQSTDMKKLYLMARGSDMDTTSDFYLDTDSNANTGFHVWSWTNCGADYLIENDIVYQYTGDGSSWSWDIIGTTNISKTPSVVETAIDLNLIGLEQAEGIKIGYGRNYEDFAPSIGYEMAFANDAFMTTIDLDQDGISDAFETSGIPIGYNGSYKTTVYTDPSDADTDDDGLNDGLELVKLNHMKYDSFNKKWYYESIDHPSSVQTGTLAYADGFSPDYNVIFDSQSETIATSQANISEANLIRQSMYNHVTKIEDYINGEVFSSGEINELREYLSDVDKAENALRDWIDIEAVDILTSEDCDDTAIAWLGSNTNYVDDIAIAGDIKFAWLGTKVHKAVEKKFEAEHPEDTTILDQPIPGSLLRPDMIYKPSDYFIYELKPSSNRYGRLNVKAKAQLQRYIDKYNGVLNPDNAAHAGVEWNPVYKTVYIPSENCAVIISMDYANEPGLVYYDWQEKLDPDPNFDTPPVVALKPDNETVTVFAKDYEHGYVLAKTSDNEILYGTLTDGYFIEAVVFDIILFMKLLKGGLSYGF